MASQPSHIIRQAPIAIACGALWIVFIVALHFISRSNPDAAPVCHLKRFTGTPCPTCGGTRATFALFQGSVIEAITWNPWIVALHLVIFLSLCTWIFRQPKLNPLGQLLGRPKLALVVLLVSLGLNWIYVLMAQG